jgi:hypothetical protein
MKVIAAQDNRLYSIIGLYDMQSGFFGSALEGISDTDAHDRLNTKANHVAWLAGSLVQQRFELANNITDGSYRQTADALFSNNQGIKEGVTYPPLEEYKKDWDTITPILREALLDANTQKLDSIIKMPGMEFPLYDLITFVIYREANCIGQIALWRRLLGYDAMKYM